MPKVIKIDQYRYMTSDAWRALLAVEMGMKNHEYVPIDLIHKISRCNLRSSAFLKLLKDDLVPHNLLAYDVDARKSYAGYRLTNLGYDYLALHTFIKSGQIIDLGSIIGAGKESDVYLAVAGDCCGRSETNQDEAPIDPNLPTKGDYIIIKFHRLGRTSFRKVKEKRNYHRHRKTCSWLYLDRLAAAREYQMMQALFENKLPVPRPLANNRNAVVMSLLSCAVLLCKVLPKTLLANNCIIASCLYTQAVNIFNKVIYSGLIHGDFNEFNLLVTGLADIDELPTDYDSDNDSKDDNVDLEKIQLILIDFPQMISRDHKNAQEIYERDLNGMLSFFSKYLDLDPNSIPPTNLSDVPRTGFLDVDLKAPGYIKKSIARKTSKETDDSDILVGTVAAIALNTLSEESCADEQESNTDSVSSTDDTDSENNNPETLNLTSKKIASSIIEKREIHERRRKEEKKKNQEAFRLRVKRQQRAKFKNEGRNNMAAEIRLFD